MNANDNNSSMNEAELREAVASCLLKGWRIENTETENNSWMSSLGMVLETQRELPGAVYIVLDNKKQKHRLWVFTRAADEKYGLYRKINRRASLLKGTHIPHIQPFSLWVDADSEKGILLIANPLPLRTIESLNLDYKKREDRYKAAVIMHGVLEGLAGLHNLLRKEKPTNHGGLRSDRIGFTTEDEEGAVNISQPVILDSLLGPLTFWTDCEVLDDEQNDFLPPKHPNIKTTMKDDVYSAGVIWMKLFGLSPESNAERKKLDACSREALYKMLMESKDDRPTATDALRLVIATMNYNQKTNGRTGFRFIWKSIKKNFLSVILTFLLILASTLWVVSRNKYLEQNVVIEDLNRRLQDARSSHIEYPPPGPHKPDRNKLIEKVCKAMDQWRVFVTEYSDRQSIREIIDNKSDADVKRLLNTWYDIASNGGKWTLYVGPGYGEANDTGRKLCIKINDNIVGWLDYNGDDDKPDYIWPNKICDYRREVVKLTINQWSMGDKITSVFLEGYGGSRWKPNPNLIKLDNPFTGQLALYRMVFEGVHQGENFLYFDFSELNEVFPVPVGWPSVTECNCMFESKQKSNVIQMLNRKLNRKTVEHEKNNNIIDEVTDNPLSILDTMSKMGQTATTQSEE